MTHAAHISTRIKAARLWLDEFDRRRKAGLRGSTAFMRGLMDIACGKDLSYRPALPLYCGEPV